MPGLKDFLKLGVVTLPLLAAPALAQSITPGANTNAPAPGSFAPAKTAGAVEPLKDVPAARPAAPKNEAGKASDAPKRHHVDVERKGKNYHDIFMGTYLTLTKECKIGTTPAIAFTQPPANGKTRTRTYPINLRQVPGAPRNNCIGTSPKGVAAVYRANARFKGEDKLIYTVTYPNGDVREVGVTITVQ